MRAEAGDEASEHSESAKDAALKASRLRFYSSGSDTLDRLLGGGFRAGRLTQVYGRSGSGKSQLGMQTALLAAREGRRTLFIDCEGSFRPERMEEVALARGWEAGQLLDRVVYARIDSSSEQMEVVRAMATRPATSSCSLVIIDTLTRNFSVELPGRSNLPSRQGSLDIHLSEMARDSYLNERAYLLTNRVTFGPTADVCIGGRTVEQLVHESLRLERDGSGVRATLLSTGESAVANLGKAGIV
jgi:DNA repair protein RadA